MCLSRFLTKWTRSRRRGSRNQNRCASQAFHFYFIFLSFYHPCWCFVFFSYFTLCIVSYFVESIELPIKLSNFSVIVFIVGVLAALIPTRIWLSALNAARLHLLDFICEDARNDEKRASMMMWIAKQIIIMQKKSDRLIWNRIWQILSFNRLWNRCAFCRWCNFR